MIQDLKSDFPMNPEQQNEIYNYLSKDGEKAVDTDDFIDLIGNLAVLGENGVQGGDALFLSPEQFAFVRLNINQLKVLKDLEGFKGYLALPSLEEKLHWQDTVVCDLFERFTLFYSLKSDDEEFLSFLAKEGVKGEKEEVIILGENKSESKEFYELSMSKLDERVEAFLAGCEQEEDKIGTETLKNCLKLLDEYKTTVT